MKKEQRNDTTPKTSNQPLTALSLTEKYSVTKTIDYHLNKYTVRDLLNIFNLSPDVTLADLKRTRREVLMLHPDKSRIVTQQHYMFLRSVHDMITSYYESLVRQNVELPENEIQYDPNSENVPINPSVRKGINDMTKKDDFNKTFNELFEGYVGKPSVNDELEWFRNGNDNETGKKIKNAEELHREIDKLRKSKTGLVVYNGEYAPITGRCANNFFDEIERDQQGYVSANIFDTLQFDDIKRVHRDQTIIGVDENEFKMAKKPRNIEEYKNNDFVPMGEQEYYRGKHYEMAEIERIHKDKLHKMKQHTTDNESKNTQFLSRFLLIK